MSSKGHQTFGGALVTVETMNDDVIIGLLQDRLARAVDARGRDVGVNDSCMHETMGTVLLLLSDGQN